jgi:hypothetical protein
VRSLLLLKEELNDTTEVFLVLVISLGGYHFRINRLREVLLNNLLPGSLILTLVHVIKLDKQVSPVEIDFLGPLFKVGDSFVVGEFDTRFAAVLVDFGLYFVARIMALQLVGIGERHFLIPFLFKAKWSSFL